jgi:hypothetical protein
MIWEYASAVAILCVALAGYTAAVITPALKKFA